MAKRSKVTAAEVLRWLRKRPQIGTKEVRFAVARACAAVTRAKQLSGEKA